MKTNTKTKFTGRCTVAENVEQLNTGTYRARVTLNGTRQSQTFTNLRKAIKWVKDSKKNS